MQAHQGAGGMTGTSKQGAQPFAKRPAGGRESELRHGAIILPPPSCIADSLPTQRPKPRTTILAY